LAHDEENSPGNADLELFTTRPIEKDQILLAIPPSIVLTSELPSPALRDLAGDAALDDMSRLALRLLHEVSQAGAGSSFQPLLFSHATSSSSFSTLPLDNSGWLPYVRVLPSRNQMDLPFLWEEDGREGGGENEGEEDSSGPEDSHDSLLALLAPSPLYDDIVALREEMRGELESLRKAVLANRTLSTSPTLLSCLTWENWSWARAIAMSRPYVLESRPSRSTEAAGRSDFFGDPVLQLLPLLDMANHDDAIHYAVQPGDGVFTAREEVQLVADRDYPEVGAPFLSSYGPLSSATKFYSFGFLDTLSLPPSARSSPPSSPLASRESREGDIPGPVPAQGTALLVLSLGGGGCTNEGNHKSEKRRSSPEMPEAAKEEMTREERRARDVLGRKLDVLNSMGLKAEGQRVEISTRTLLTRRLGSEKMVAVVRLEGGEEGGEGGMEGGGGGMDRLRRYLRLKHMGEEDINGFLNAPPPPGSSSSSLDEKQVWNRLASPLSPSTEVKAAVEALQVIREGLQNVEDRWERVRHRLKEEGRKGEREGGREGGRVKLTLRRLGLLQTLWHGELLALRATAEVFLKEMEGLEGEMKGGREGGRAGGKAVS
jgi:hypothetical protein